MKKIVRQQNYLKDLIESQENPLLSKQALKCIIRAVLAPLLDNPEESVVLHRIFNKSGVLGLLKRLEFSDTKSFDFSDEGGLLKEKVWANTEFLCVLTHRFVAIYIWDSKTDNQNYVRYYSIVNSRLQNEALDIIGRNTDVDIKDFQERFKPDRRDNFLLNSSIRQLVTNMDEATKDAILGFAQIQSEKETEEINQNTRQIAHEIRNQLSICDLYTTIIKKYCLKNNIKDDKILNAVDCIVRASKMAGNSLVNLKTSDKIQIKPYNLKTVINTAVDLIKVYFEDKNIEFVLENDTDANIPIDENRLLAVIINLIKNGVEAFGTNILQDVNVLETVSNNKNVTPKYIKLITESEEDIVKIRILNNAGKIEEPSKIFDEGYTTKKEGSGLGLIIAKKSVEEMFGELKLEHSDDEYTEFVIKLAKVK